LRGADEIQAMLEDSIETVEICENTLEEKKTVYDEAKGKLGILRIEFNDCIFMLIKRYSTKICCFHSF